MVLVGDYNVVATDGIEDIYSPNSWRNDALLQPEIARAPTGACSRRAGPTRFNARIPARPVYTFWDYFRDRFARDAGLRIDHLLLNPPAAGRLQDAGVDRAVRGREKPSDHAPTWVVLAEPGSPSVA